MTKMKLLIILLITVLSACGPFGFTGMTPDQIASFAKIKDAGITCINGLYAGANITWVNVNADKGVPTNMTVDNGCKITFGQTIK